MIKDSTKLAKNLKIKNKMKETFLRRKSQKCSVVTLKIQKNKLTQKQLEQLKMIFVEGKWIYNNIVSLKSAYGWDGNYKNVKVLNKDKQEEVRQTNFITRSMSEEIHKQIKSNIKTLKKLKEKGYQLPGRLKYKSKLQMVNLRSYGQWFKFTSKNKMKIEGVSKTIRVCGSNQLTDDMEFSNAKLLNTPKGYYIAITTFIDKNKIKKENKILPPIGIDFGCSTSLTISDGEKINVLVEESERLKRLQKRLAKKIKRSNNSYKIINLIQKEYQKLDNVKNDIANKVIHKLLEHKLVVFQDENLSGWKKSGHGKKVQHSILGRVKEKLRLANNTVMLDRFCPTTKMCICGHKNNLKLSDRQFACTKCDYKDDRDIHAAKNMLRFFTSGTDVVSSKNKACGEDVRLLRSLLDLSNEGFKSNFQ